MEELGHITRLQVQIAPLKRGQKPDRWYDASRIRQVDALTVAADGVLGHVDGEDEPIVDVHHRAHPASRHRGGNGLSLGITGHYAWLRARFGDHLVDGIAGENVLLDQPNRIHLEDIAAGVHVLGETRLELAPVAVVEPCVEFSRLVLDDPDAWVREPLQQLRGGMRGFYLGVRDGVGGRIRLGDLVVRA